MRGMRDKAHAKLNLWLHVGEKLEDGFHEIDTCFLALQLHDTVTFFPAPEPSVTCNIPELSGENNLAYKAIRLMAEFINVPSYEVRIHKEIPVQAGLGGGSSDAASALYCFNKISGNLMSPNDLHQIGLVCGADVPFFLSRKACAEAKGRGDEVHPIPAPPSQTVVLAMPSEGNPTGRMYSSLDELLDRPLGNRDRKKGGNDFELVASPVINNLIRIMNESGIGKTMLCGSGSAVACITGDEKRASDLSADLQRKGYWTTLTQTLTQIEEPQWTA